VLLCFVHAGYKPFVEACIEEEENAEALKYIAKLTDPQERAEVCPISSH
jgi:hypothetical protein